MGCKNEFNMDKNRLELNLNIMKSGASSNIAVYKEGIKVYDSPVFSNGVITREARVVDPGANVFSADQDYVRDNLMVVDVTQIGAREMISPNGQNGISSVLNQQPHVATPTELNQIASMMGDPMSTDNVWNYTNDRGASLFMMNATGDAVNDNQNQLRPYNGEIPPSLKDSGPNYNIPVITTIVAKDDITIQTDPANDVLYGDKIPVPDVMLNPKITIRYSHFYLTFDKLKVVAILPTNYPESCVVDGEYEADNLQQIGAFCENYSYMVRKLTGQL